MQFSTANKTGKFSGFNFQDASRVKDILKNNDNLNLDDYRQHEHEFQLHAHHLFPKDPETKRASSRSHWKLKKTRILFHL